MKMTISLLTLAMAACTNGQGDVDVTTSNQSTFLAATALPDALGLRASLTTETDVTLDVHDELASMAKVGTLSVAISKDSLSGADLTVVDEVTATIAAADGTMPVQSLAKVVVPRGSSEVGLSGLLTDAQILEYLSEGPVVLHLTLTGNLPERPILLTHSLVAHVGIAVASSVAKF
jgi:hypothetical protein